MRILIIYVLCLCVGCLSLLSGKNYELFSILVFQLVPVNTTCINSDKKCFHLLETSRYKPEDIYAALHYKKLVRFV